MTAEDREIRLRELAQTCVGRVWQFSDGSQLGEVAERYVMPLLRAHEDAVRAEAEELRSALAASLAREADLREQTACPQCGCATPDDAEANECGCDAPVCAHDAAVTLAEAFEAAEAKLEKLKEEHGR
jgi:hypothetical protein